MQNPSIVSFLDVTLGYDSHPAVHHLSGALVRGSLTAVLGANGSGKSTLLKGVAGLLKPIGGEIAVAAGTRVAYLPQQSELDRSFPARVEDLVALGLWPVLGLLGRIRPAHRARIAAAIEAVGLKGFETRGIDTLSGGQFQRALFARVLLQDAQLILLDEPFNAVDTRTVEHLVSLIDGWRAEGRTVVTVLHDVELARRHFPETLLMARRPIAWGPTQTVLTAANLDSARHFDEAWKDEAPWCAADDDHNHAATMQPKHDHAHHHGDHSHGHKRAAE